MSMCHWLRLSYLSSKKGKEAYVQPIIEGDGYRFEGKVGKLPNEARNGTSAGRRRAFRCLMSGAPIPYDYIRREGQSGRMGVRLMAVVAAGNRGRVYFGPTITHESAARQATAPWKPEIPLPSNPRDFKTPNYGLPTFGDLFTPRQLVALTTFSDQVDGGTKANRARMLSLPACPTIPRELKRMALAPKPMPKQWECIWRLRLSKVANDYWSSISSWISSWMSDRGAFRETFARQAIPMIWDYAECKSVCCTFWWKPWYRFDQLDPWFSNHSRQTQFR